MGKFAHPCKDTHVWSGEEQVSTVGSALSFFLFIVPPAPSYFPIWRSWQMWSGSPQYISSAFDSSSVIAWGCSPCNEQQPSLGKQQHAY